MILKSQNQIIEKWQKNKPSLAIFLLTYNHEKYIRQALDSILMQETTYPYKIFVFDDASTDSNPKIILEYKKKYPDLFELYLGKENLYKTPNLLKKKIYSFFFKQIAGYKYFAICEGDDFWTYPFKNQVQISFLEENKKFSCCGSLAYIKDEIKKKNFLIDPLKSSGIFNLADFAYGKKGYHPANASRMYNTKKILQFKEIEKLFISDTFMMLCAYKVGLVKVLNYATCTYRVHSKGTWSSKSKLEQHISNYKNQDFLNKNLNYEFKHDYDIKKSRINGQILEELIAKIKTLEEKVVNLEKNITNKTMPGNSSKIKPKYPTKYKKYN